MCGRRIPALSGRLLVVITLVLLLAGCINAPPGDDDAAPEPPADSAILAFFDGLAGDPSVTFDTDHGEIPLLVHQSLMPVTAGRFIDLVGTGFHDGTIIHRVVDDFVIQGGDPSGTGLLGSGQTIPFESHPDLPFSYGSMGLARDIDPDSGDSQWFITEKPQPHLTDPSGTTGTVFGTYAMFGQVYANMDIVQAIAQVETVPGADRPVQDVRVRSATVGPPPDIDLLRFPHTLESATGQAFTTDIVHPLHTFTDRPFPITIIVTPVDDARLPTTVHATLHRDDAHLELVLQPTERDPAVFTNEAILPDAGAWTLTAHAGDDSATDTIKVHPWHPEYARYDRRGAAPEP